MRLKQIFYIVLFLTPCFGFSQVYPINFNYYDFIPDYIDDYFGEVDSLLLENNIQKITTLCKTKETDSLQLLRIQYIEKGRKVKDERYELSTGKLERLIQYVHSTGKLDVEMMHYPSVENGYRLPARHFRYLLNADYIHPYQPDSLGRIKMNLRYTWQNNSDILYETFDFKGKSIEKKMMALKSDALQRWQRFKPSYPRIVKRAVDEYNTEETHFNKWKKLSLYKNCNPRSGYGNLDLHEFNDKGLEIRQRSFEESPTSRKLALEYVFVYQ